MRMAAGGVEFDFMLTIFSWLFFVYPQNGDTALICAASQGNTDCVRLLVEAAAKLNITDHVRTMFCLTFCLTMSVFVVYVC